MAGVGDLIDLVAYEETQSNEIFKSLMDIFPDGDPEYFNNLACSNVYNTSALNLKIECFLQSKDYPKQIIAPKSEETGQETTQSSNRDHLISVDKFLLKFNDPKQYFKERDVGKHFEFFSKSYLMNRYRFVGVRAIMSVLKNCNYNLTRSVETLNGIKNDRSTKRGKNELKDNYSKCQDDRFFDEIFFLENEEEITIALSMKEEKIKLRLEEARFNNELLECQCCFNDEILSQDVITCVEGHIFCKDCVKRSVEISFGDGLTLFKCLTDCNSSFSLKCLENVVANSLFKKIEVKIQEAEIKSAEIPGICFCPFCEYAEIPPVDTTIFNCRMCKKESCMLCQRESHIPFKCDEIEKDKARNLVEDKMTEALVRQCYKCKAKFIKSDGCNKMTCTCGATMCYICRQPVKNYSHFQDNSHRHHHPSTSQNTNKCPLWSNNNELHVNEVVKAARTAAEEVRSANPHILIDPKKMLKGLKRPHH